MGERFLLVDGWERATLMMCLMGLCGFFWCNVR